MSDRFQKRTSSILATALIGLIVVSFMFGDFGSKFGNTPDSIGKVGDIPVTIKEYQSAYQQQLDYIKQIFGGKELTSKQIEQFNVKNGAIDNVVNRKLLVILANEMEIAPSAAEVADFIKELPYFLNEQKQFDITRYKMILNANGLTPANFEKDLVQDIKLRKLMAFTGQIPTSKKYLDDLAMFKKRSLMMKGIQIAKKDLESLLPVSKEEIAKFIADTKNTPRIETIFQSRKSTLDQPEQVNARHILLRTDDTNSEEVLKKANEIKKQLTPANFAKLAEKYTEDPSGKTTGGTLGWFSKGRMVPEFEAIAFSLKANEISAPIKTDYGYHIILVEDKKVATIAKIEDHKETIATELIRKDNKDGLKKLSKEIELKMTAWLDMDNFVEIEKFQKDINFTIEKEGRLNKLDGAVGKLTMSEAQIETIFKDKFADKKTFAFDETMYLYVIKAERKETEANIDLAKEEDALKKTLAQQLQGDFLKNLRDEHKVNINTDVLN